jgi:hypothetical protein
MFILGNVKFFYKKVCVCVCVCVWRVAGDHGVLAAFVYIQVTHSVLKLGYKLGTYNSKIMQIYYQSYKIFSSFKSSEIKLRFKRV